MSLPATKIEAFKGLLETFSDILSNNGCNDFKVVNTPEMFIAIEEFGARNLRMSLKEFRECSEYKDYEPSVSEDGQHIYTQDYVILDMIKHELGF